MNIIRYTFLIIAICISSLYKTSAQVNGIQKNKFFKTWISTNHGAIPLKGILYEIKDSSISVSNSKFRRDYLTGNFKTSDVNFNDIDIIRIRRVNSVGTGAVLGGAGFGIPIINLVIKNAGGDFLITYIAYSVALEATAIGAIAGAAIGSLRGRIPVRSSFEKFNRNRSLLQQYSYINESSQHLNILAFKGNAGIVYGPSFSSGTFFKIPENPYNTVSPRAGFGGNVNAEYRFSEYYGISVSQFSGWYYVAGTDHSVSWNFGGISFGPVFSVPVNNKLFLDIKPDIGYANAFLVDDNNIILNGNGLGMSLTTSLTYNLIGRWGFTTEAGYIYSRQKFSEISKGNFNSINLDLGIVYRFLNTGL